MMAAWLLLFVAGVVVSLSASWLLVSRLERLGDRAGLSEAWLGLVAALAADAPEITSAVTALARGQSSIGAGVVIGSNVFNLAALLGLSAVVAGRVAFHRRVMLLAGLPGVWVAAVCLLTVTAVVSPAAGHSDHRGISGVRDRTGHQRGAGKGQPGGRRAPRRRHGSCRCPAAETLTRPGAVLAQHDVQLAWMAARIAAARMERGSSVEAQLYPVFRCRGL